MGTFRPAFRTIAQTLTDIDLVLVEEAFERLLLVSEHAIKKRTGYLEHMDHPLLHDEPLTLWG